MLCIHLFIHIFIYIYINIYIKICECETHCECVEMLTYFRKKKMRITVHLVVHVQPELGNSFDWLSEIIFVICDLFLSGLSVCSQRGQRRPDGG